MPTYDYECTKGHQFEVVQRMTEPPLKRCKICRSKVQRLISAPAFILKGGGWYSDGYSSGGNGSSANDKPTGEKQAPAKPSGGSSGDSSSSSSSDSSSGSSSSAASGSSAD